MACGCDDDNYKWGQTRTEAAVEQLAADVAQVLMQQEILARNCQPPPCGFPGGGGFYPYPRPSPCMPHAHDPFGRW